MPGVYVLLDPNTQFVKIGRATNLDERLANLKTANPRLALVEWFETINDSLVESYVHAKLVEHRKEGEFFDVKPATAQEEINKIITLLKLKPQKSDIEKTRAIQSLKDSRPPQEDELVLVKKIIQLRAEIKALETEENIYSERLMISLAECKGLIGWATFEGSSTSRFETARFQYEQPDFAKDFLKITYNRTLKIRPGMAQ